MLLAWNVRRDADRADALHVALIAASVYEHRALTGAWPDDAEDLARTSLAAQAPHDLELVRTGRYTVHWPGPEWSTDPAANAARVLVESRPFRTRSWSGLRWVCFGDLRAELLMSRKTLVLAHRGASGYLPDHTLEAYGLAVDQGADWIEPDLVATKDGVLVARHENELSQTTDVAERFPDRRTVKTVDGQRVEGWFTEDLTLAELKSLRARQPLPERPHDHDGRYAIPTFDEICAWVAEKEREVGRRIGLVPETKHPSYFDGLGLSLEEPLVRTLAAHGYDAADDPVIVQSFETGNLRELERLSAVRRLRLVDTETELLTPAGLRDVRAYAHAIGVAKSAVIDADGAPTSLVADAHAVGLDVHVYTFRNEPRFLPAWAGGDPVAELRAFYAIGVDAVFADFPDTAVRARPGR